MFKLVLFCLTILNWDSMTQSITDPKPYSKVQTVITKVALDEEVKKKICVIAHFTLSEVTIDCYPFVIVSLKT